MTSHLARMMRVCVVSALVLLTVACATRPAPDFRGRWKPMNQFAEAPVELPLQQNYVYSASPMDKTLKALLTRWARASRQTLSYLHSSDFTLYGPVQDVNTTSLGQAISQLDAAYAPYGVAITVEGGQIIVRNAQQATVASPAEATP